MLHHTSQIAINPFVVMLKLLIIPLNMDTGRTYHPFVYCRKRKTSFFRRICMILVVFNDMGIDDTMESWFKIGGADAIIDRLLADGKTKPCIVTTSAMDFMPQGGGSGMRMPGFSPRVLRADDYPTWSQRRRALVKLLLEIGREPDAQFPGFGRVDTEQLSQAVLLELGLDTGIQVSIQTIGELVLGIIIN